MSSFHVEEHREPHRVRRSNGLLWFLGGIAVTVAIVVVLIILGNSATLRNNARCQVCGHEFYAEFFEGRAERTRMHECPNCLHVDTSMHFHDRYRRDKGKPITP